MKRNQLPDSVSDQSTSQVDHDAADENINETDLLLFKASAEHYERRWRNRIKFNRGDWWLAIGVYLMLASVAFVAL